MKRSKNIKLAVMGLTPFALTACSDKPVEMLVYENPRQCEADGYYSLPQCEEAYDQALEVHRESAPKYRWKNECEMDFYDTACEKLGDYYTPLPYAFVMPLPYSDYSDDDVDNFYYGGGAGYYNRRSKRTQPLYLSRDDYGYYRTSDNRRMTRSITSGRFITQLDNTAMPARRSQTLSRGGFGLQAAARSRVGGAGFSFGG